MNLSPSIIEQANYWATSQAFDDATRAEIAKLIEAKDEKEITERFYRNLEFGTGGLRGILGAGTSRMNIYNVRKASQALATYLLETFSGEIKVAISHDSRQFSREFAEAAAEVLAANTIKSVITQELRPVPMLSFMTRHYQCKAGICVTASHNPPDYNGFKVYWETGSQLIPPHDKNIINHYNQLTDYEKIKREEFDAAVAAGMIKVVGKEFDEEYFRRVEALSLFKKGRKDFKIVYTPLHGAGLYPVREILKRTGFEDVFVPPEQEIPDGTFPTVSSPNPENPEAMAVALSWARKRDADLVMATDPDCDRIGMIVKDGDDYFIPNGNQIMCILTDFFLSALKESGAMPDNPLVIKTIVTTEMQREIAESYGVECEDTLTGFKWICGLIEDYESGHITPKKTYVCGGEESYGFLADSFVRDKDGVISCLVAAEMIASYKARGQTITQVLDQLYAKYGVYYETLYNLVLPGKEGAEKISNMMKRIRANPPTAIDGIPVKTLRDIQSSQELNLYEGQYQQGAKISLPRSNVLQFLLEDGTRVSVRPSGTEPKIKFYVSVKDASGKGKSGAELAAVKDQCEQRARRIEQIFLEMSQ